MNHLVLSSRDAHLVLFSSTHVMFLGTNDQRLAEVLAKKDVHFRNATIERVAALPPGVQVGKAYRHYSPREIKRLKH